MLFLGFEMKASMSRRQIWFYSTLITTIGVILLLVTGSSILTLSLDSDGLLPLGTLITWVGFITLLLAVFWGNNGLRHPKGKFKEFISRSFKVIFLLAVLWAPLAYLLAGNLSFTFSERETFQGGQLAMKLFWNLSYGIAIAALLIQILLWLSHLFKRP